MPAPKTGRLRTRKEVEEGIDTVVIEGIPVPKGKKARKLPRKKGLTSTVNKELAEPFTITEDNLSYNGDLLLDRFGVPFVDQHAASKRTTALSSTTKAESEETRKKLETVRLYLSFGRGDGDAVSHFANLWGLAVSTVRGYISVARKMNLNILEITPEQAKSDSVNFWSNELHSQKVINAKFLGMVSEIQGLIKQADELLKESRSGRDPETAKQARLAAVQLRLVLSQARYIKSDSEGKAYELRDRLDKILGVMAPLKVKLEGEINHEVTVKSEPTHMADVIDLVVAAASKDPMLKQALIDKLNEPAPLLAIPGELANDSSPPQ